MSWEHAIKIADLALYRAKRGRNAWRGWFGTEHVATLQSVISAVESNVDGLIANGVIIEHMFDARQRRHGECACAYCARRAEFKVENARMDSDIRDALARSLPDLALIVRRDGVILSCVGGQAVRGLDTQEEAIPGRTARHAVARVHRRARVADGAQNPQDTQARAAALPGRRPQARNALPGAGLRPRARRLPRPRRRRHGQRLRPVSAERQRHAAASRRLRKIAAHGARHGRAARRHRGCRAHPHRRLRHLSTRVRFRARQSPARSPRRK